MVEITPTRGAALALSEEKRFVEAGYDFLDEKRTLLAKKLLEGAADQYRQKYELTTRRFDDMRLAINYLSALKRIHTLLGETEGAEVTKRKIEIWKSKMESDMKQAKHQSRHKERQA